MKYFASRLFVMMTVLVLLVSGCATTQERLLDSDSSQVELRSFQTRTFDTTEREKTLRTVMATLQDLGFVIDQADAMLGVVSATKLNRYALRITVSIRPKGETQTLIRANCQYGNKPVNDPEPYQSFFTSLDKAMFLTAHTEGGGAGTAKKQTGNNPQPAQKNSATATETKPVAPTGHTAEMIKPDSEYKQGDTVLLEFNDKSSKIITITGFDEKFISGYYDYQGGGYQVEDVWDRHNIASMKRVRVITGAKPTVPTQPKLEDVFKNGDVVVLEFKNGNTKEIILTYMNDRVVAGQYQYSRGATTPVNYDRRDIKKIRYADKNRNKVNYDVNF